MQVLPARNTSTILSFLVFLAFVTASLPASGQPVMQEEVNRELQDLSEEELDLKLKQLGLTRAEAIERASQLGIELEPYLDARLAVESSLPDQLPKNGKLHRKIPETLGKQRPVFSEDHPPLSPAGLPYFGYDIFLSVPEAFEPTAVGPVDPEYLLGPGDALRVAVWGQVEFERELTVDREGKVFISTVGQVIVSGMTLEKAREKLLRQMSRSYSGLVSEPRTVWLDVSLANLRPKRVFVMGEVNSPGGYTVSSYSSVFNTLYSIGGPTVNGTLRSVSVVRGGTRIATVDLYDYLLGAEETNDIRVQSNDIIFVPVRGKTVSVKGAVRRPATYELLDGETLSDLLRFSGGLLPDAYTPNAQIERIRPFSERTGGIEDRYVVDTDLREMIAGRAGTALFDNDNIQVFSVLDVLTNYAVVRGSVWRPGRYELGQIRTIKDLIDAAEGLQPRTYREIAHLIRFNEDQITTRIIPVSLSEVFEGSKQNLLLNPRDELIVYSAEIIEESERYVTIRGSVRNPGRYPYRDGMTLKDLIPIAGGYSEDAEILEGIVSRSLRDGVSDDSLVTVLRPLLPTDFGPLASDQQALPGSNRDHEFHLVHKDEVLVRSKPNYMGFQNISVTGDVVYPGVYAIRKRGERLSDILIRAGGPTSSSYLGGAQFYRKGQRLLVDFSEAFHKNNLLHDIIVQGGDSIAVPAHPNTVLILGEVNKPGMLSFIDGDDVMDYVDRAGGLSDSAHYALLTKPTGETRKVTFGMLSSNPSVPEGSTIEVVKEKPPRPSADSEFFATVKDIFALLASVAAVAFIVVQTSK